MTRAALALFAHAAADLGAYNVIWTDLLSESNGIWSNSMPIGNGDTAANVWADNATGSVSLLLSKQDAWGEDAELRKVGLVTVSFDPNPFAQGASFRQELVLAEATVKFTIGDLVVSTYIDAFSNVLRLDAQSGSDFDVRVTSAALRSEASTSEPAFDCESYVVAADVATSTEDELIVYHRNSDFGDKSYFRQTLAGQNIDTPEMLATVDDPFTNFTFGSVVLGEGLRAADTALTGQGLRSLRLAVGVAALQDNSESASAWLEAARAQAKTTPAPDVHGRFWADFWARSRVVLGSAAQRQTVCNDPVLTPPEPPWDCQIFGCTCQAMADYYGAQHGVSWGCAPAPAQDWWSNVKNCQADAKAADHPGCKQNENYCQDEFVISRQYAVQRYLQAIQARSPFPIKFNGMLFTAQKPPQVDFRQWGGHNWWQNWRLPYYNMLAAGDGDLLETMFQFFSNTLPLAQLRTRAYYPNFTDGGAAFFSEYTSPLGTTHPDSYGCGRAGKTSPPISYSNDEWNHYNVQGILDASLLFLDHFVHTQDTDVFAAHVPFVAAAVEWFRQRWQENGVDADGNIIIYPTQALETWQCPGFPPTPDNCVTNDSPTVAGLQAVMSRLVVLPTSTYQGLVPDATLAKWRAFAETVPPLPFDSEGALAPCEKCPSGTSNVENAELYAVHPYRLYTAASGQDLAPAMAAFHKMRFPGDGGWNQVAMDAALLGLASEAQGYVRTRARTPPAKGYRFPGFMPHEQDYPPSSDHLAVFSNALTYMLLQTADDDKQSVLLLPAWPCDWDVSFKLHAPLRTVIEGVLTNGSFTYSVDPPSRAGAVRSARCQLSSKLSVAFAYV